jgi:signal transduction histidine kinase
VPLELVQVPADQLIDRVAGRAEVLARERGATLDADVAGSGLLRADPDRIEQAVLILVDNAAKYGEPGGSVELGAHTRDGWLIVEVGDRGEGIPDEQLSRIFERFYRLDGGGRDRTNGGAGLGLSIAAAIVEGHGGQVSATRRPGGGTIMTLTLPLLGASAPLDEEAG